MSDLEGKRETTYDNICYWPQQLLDIFIGPDNTT
jgi:hypothetical protein